MLDIATASEVPTLKAYQVNASYEGGSVVVYATSSAAARREGAAELDTDFEGVESCRRAPELDGYAPGPVPPMVLLQNGWWFECVNCGTRVSLDREEDGDGQPLDPCVSGQSVYCTRACRAARFVYERQRQAAQSALVEWVEARYPEAVTIHPHVYGQSLEKVDLGKPVRSSVTFTLPELRYPVSWEFGHSQIKVSRCDVDMFRALYAGELSP